MTHHLNAPKGTERLKLPIGISAFEFMRTQGYVYY